MFSLSLLSPIIIFTLFTTLSHRLMMGFMSVSSFLSMWISNTHTNRCRCSTHLHMHTNTSDLSEFHKLLFQPHLLNEKIVCNVKMRQDGCFSVFFKYFWRKVESSIIFLKCFNLKQSLAVFSVMFTKRYFLVILTHEAEFGRFFLLKMTSAVFSLIFTVWSSGEHCFHAGGSFLPPPSCDLNAAFLWSYSTRYSWLWGLTANSLGT